MKTFIEDAVVVTMNPPDGPTEVFVVAAPNEATAIALTQAHLRSIDYDNLDAIEFTARTYDSVTVLGNGGDR